MDCAAAGRRDKYVGRGAAAVHPAVVGKTHLLFLLQRQQRVKLPQRLVMRVVLPKPEIAVARQRDVRAAFGLDQNKFQN